MCTTAGGRGELEEIFGLTDSAMSTSVLGASQDAWRARPHAQLVFVPVTAEVDMGAIAKQ
jgi:hypothetical protein